MHRLLPPIRRAFGGGGGQNQHHHQQQIKFIKMQKYVVKTMGVSLRDAVKLPLDGSSSRNEWLAFNTIDFFNQISFLFAVVADSCVSASCPCMSAGPRFEFLWAVKPGEKPERLPARLYIQHLLKWIERYYYYLRRWRRWL